MKVLIVHGPNLNMLGRREPGIYGASSLDDINFSLRNLAEELAIDLDIVQNNAEGGLITAIQESIDNRIDGIVINPGAYTHTSIALRDALLSVNLPFIEVHVSNTFAREAFRHKSYLSDVASGVIIGLGPVGYLFALRALVQLLKLKHVAKMAEDVTSAPAEA